jgi:hypothetical protein
VAAVIVSLGCENLPALSGMIVGDFEVAVFVVKVAVGIV